jgi:hypothetical protein
LQEAQAAKRVLLDRIVAVQQPFLDNAPRDILVLRILQTAQNVARANMLPNLDQVNAHSALRVINVLT